MLDIIIRERAFKFLSLSNSFSSFLVRVDNSFFLLQFCITDEVYTLETRNNSIISKIWLFIVDKNLYIIYYSYFSLGSKRCLVWFSPLVRIWNGNLILDKTMSKALVIWSFHLFELFLQMFASYYMYFQVGNFSVCNLFFSVLTYNIF